MIAGTPARTKNPVILSLSKDLCEEIRLTGSLVKGRKSPEQHAT
jgi:hypothetical protein